jgi:hypothetical protein
LAFSAVRKQKDAPAPIPALPGAFALAITDPLKQSFLQAVFQDFKIKMQQITFDFGAAESYTKPHQQITAPIHAMLATHPKEVKNRVLNSITEAV